MGAWRRNSSSSAEKLPTGNNNKNNFELKKKGGTKKFKRKSFSLKRSSYDDDCDSLPCFAVPFRVGINEKQELETKI